jgi:nucleoid-associated protein YgaU
VLTLNLFYDVTEPVNGTVLDDVRQLTNKMAALTQKPDGQQQPPAVTVSWGADPPPGSDFPFTGVVTRLTQNFKLFSRDGKPLRADLTVELTEFFDPETKQKPRAELTSLLVKQGDTLSGIAATNYRDPGRWREIAEANNLDDPRKLAPGLRLSIPKSG